MDRETMGDFLERRRSRNVTIAVISTALVGQSLVVAAVLGPKGYNDYPWVFGLSGFISFTALNISFFLGARPKCPRCGKDLPGSAQYREIPDHCPNCGVNFNQPMPQNPIPPGR
jgi:hypothetical protein